MKKYFVAIALYTGTVFLIVFAFGGKGYDLARSKDNFLAQIGFQNTPSQSTSTATSTRSVTDAIQQLQNQVQFLNNEVADLGSQVEIVNLRDVFTRTLKRGDTGDDVSKLQELLTRLPQLSSSSDAFASSTVTGFYGSFTKAAVTQFQSEAGLKETGVFDPGTREKLYESLNELAQENASTEFVPIYVSSTVDQKTSAMQANIADLQNQEVQLSSDLSNAEQEIANLQNQLAEQSLQAPLPQVTSVPVPTPTPAPTPTTAPAPALAISNVHAANITKTSSTITWTTNNLSTSEVDYSQDSNMPTNQIVTASSTIKTVNHSVVLLLLNSGTKYYYRVVSKDITGAIASSTGFSFVTLH